MRTHQYISSKISIGSDMAYPGKLLVLLLSMALLAPASAAFAQAEQEEPQQEYAMPKWFFGIAGAANLNFYDGTTRYLSEDGYNGGPFVAPAAFHDGFGIKPYGAGLVEYLFNDRWGLTFKLGYDGRGGLWDEVMAPCDCPSELKTNLSYFVFEPSLRFAPFRGNFHLFAGPRLSFNFEKDFTYTRDLQHTDGQWTHEGEWSNLNEMMLSAQIGAGYDILLSKATKKTKFVLTPFVSFHPYFGQVPRDIDTDTWSITTVRAGLALKIGRGVPIPLPVETEPIEPEPVPEPELAEPPVSFGARPPVLAQRTITNEIFPLRNYVFFDEGATSIPGRYVLLSATEAQGFREEDLKNRVLIDSPQRVRSQMHIYYNILNIMGDRMRNYPHTNIVLAGSSAGQGADAGKQLAEAVKTYLVNNFGIDAQRISTRGSDRPSIQSFRHAQQTDTGLRLDSDRRVEMLSADHELLMGRTNARSGNLRPVMFSRSDEGELDSHLVFNLSNAERYMEEWSVELTDPTGQSMQFGPYTASQASVPGADILDKGAAGTYQVVMTGTSREGLEFTRETTVELIPVDVIENHVIRFSMLYEFDRSETPAAYKDYLVETVAQLVPENARIVIHGHTDIIGDEEHNRALSLQRARDAKKLIESALKTYGINGVEFEVYGLGEMKERAPFPNRFPEERFYNRTVIIDIIPR